MEANEVPKPRTSVAAISSLVCGLLMCIPFVTGLAAVILGIVGMKKTKDPMVTGKGMAIACLALGVLSLGLSTAATVTIVAGGAGVYALLQAGEPARLVAEQFVRNTTEGKIDEAAALAEEGMDRAVITALAEKMKPWGAFKSLLNLAVDIKDTNGKVTATITGLATFAKESKAYSATLTKEGETSYKVAKFDFQ